jgi:hypothetical protein
LGCVQAVRNRESCCAGKPLGCEFDDYPKARRRLADFLAKRSEVRGDERTKD